MILNVKEIVKKYGSQQVLDNVSLSIDKGEIVGFLGPNGAGKTTTMKIISGVISPDSGIVFIDEYNMAQEPLKAKKRLGYLPEDNPLYDDMYVPEYLEYVLKLYAKGNIKEKVRRIILETGLTLEAHKKIGQLSKGYKQRVGLAQAIIHEPNLLILDEPASGLDPNQMDEVNNLILNLSRTKAILFSSHTLSEVQAICTRIIIIHKGRILLDTPATALEDLERVFKQLTREKD